MLAVCSLLFAAGAKAQTGIVITYYNGFEQPYAVATTGKLYFENGSLQIMSTGSAAAVSIPVAIIRKITFSNSNSALPLQFVDFTIAPEKAQVLLSWKTADEVNTSYFLIERSTDGTSYESIGQVASLNNSTGGSYTYADLFPKTGVSYYRLKQVDVDGKYAYSKVLTVNRSASAGIMTLLPNPAHDYIRINSTNTERLQVKIYSLTGRLMSTGNYAPGEQIPISKLTPGMYMAVINDKAYKLIKH